MTKKVVLHAILAITMAALIVLLVLYVYFLHWRNNTASSLPGNAYVTELSGGTLEYRLEGEGDQTILLLHGTPGTHAHLDVEVFIEAGFQVLIVSRPGYMRSSLNSWNTPEAQASAYRELLDYLGLGDIVVLGISGGGPSALQMALRHPDRVKALVMYGAVSQAIEFAAPQLANRLTNTEFGLWLAFTWVAKRGDDPDNTKIASLYLQTFFPIQSVWDGLENDLRNMEKLPVFDLTNMEVPVLVMHGTDDRIVLFSHGHFVASTAPNATLVRLENATHDGLVTNFDSDMQSVIDWLGNLP
jgi:pimeloyl-ACP methyl ester carboxylesterase